MSVSLYLRRRFTGLTGLLFPSMRLLPAGPLFCSRLFSAGLPVSRWVVSPQSVCSLAVSFGLSSPGHSHILSSRISLWASHRPHALRSLSYSLGSPVPGRLAVRAFFVSRSGRLSRPLVLRFPSRVARILSRLSRSGSLSVLHLSSLRRTALLPLSLAPRLFVCPRAAWHTCHYSTMISQNAQEAFSIFFRRFQLSVSLISLIIFYVFTFLVKYPTIPSISKTPENTTGNSSITKISSRRNSS